MPMSNKKVEEEDEELINVTKQSKSKSKSKKDTHVSDSDDNNSDDSEDEEDTNVNVKSKNTKAKDTKKKDDKKDKKNTVKSKKKDESDEEENSEEEQDNATTKKSISVKKKKLPKRALSAYNIYVQKTIDEAEGDNHREKMTYVGNKWSELNDKQRKKYEDIAKVEKEKWEIERAKLPPDDNTYRKTKKISNKPKKAPSAYNLYVKHSMQTAKENGEDVTMGAVAKEWKTLSDKKKEKFKDEADKLKIEQQIASATL